LKKALVDALAALPVAEDGESVTVYVYISSHGGVDAEGRHYLLLAGEKLYRANIEAAIRRTKPQLGILLTDACSNREEIKVLDRKTYDNWAEGKKLIDRLLGEKPLPPNKEMIRGLVLGHKGFVDINSCLPKQRAAADRRRGGYFTACFGMACCHDAATMAPPPRRTHLPKALEGKVEGKDFRIQSYKVDRNGDGFIDWAEFSSWLVTPYLGIFRQSADQSLWIIRLN
jgi:hypothetical protein